MKRFMSRLIKWRRVYVLGGWIWRGTVFVVRSDFYHMMQSNWLSALSKNKITFITMLIKIQIVSNSFVNNSMKCEVTMRLNIMICWINKAISSFSDTHTNKKALLGAIDFFELSSCNFKSQTIQITISAVQYIIIKLFHMLSRQYRLLSLTTAPQTFYYR